MDWVVSIVRDGVGFQMVEGTHPDSIGSVTWTNQRLIAAITAPISEAEAAFLGTAVCDYVTTSGRIPQIAEALLQPVKGGE